ncbi:hypothetical protein B0J11DRAFT_542169 [Dendryphion nanum]|uniref:DOMON domain-containing protein n=1 Tax=Dendryphion nanum TaxID=256645 RepID=A0A9P9D5J0_9PLEO|nr:hypothetical protein B0J11DRAFT_542169 [Dendryphion nanum]
MMLSSQRVGVTILALFSLLPAIIHAQNATFFYEKTETQFSVILANESSGDVHFYLSSPAYSWVGFGFGATMAKSLMFIFYPSQDGNNVTISPRIANGHTEPIFAPNIRLEIQDGTRVNDSMFIAKFICKSCRDSGFIDARNSQHPMMYAFGPGHRLQSNALNAPLKRHMRYGQFNMDMLAATGAPIELFPQRIETGVERVGDLKRDHDRANVAHTIMGCLALFVLWPLNVILAGFFKRISIHIGMSILIVVFLIVSYALGIATSHQFNRSSAFSSPHQIFAFISLFPILLLSLLPLPPLSRLTPLLPRLHTPLASLTFTLLVLTGGLGLHLSSQTTPIILGYTAVTLIVSVFVFLLQACVRRRGSRYARAKGRGRGQVEEEEDEQNLVLKAYLAGKGDRRGSEASADGGAHQQQQQQQHQQHERTPSGNANIYGGGSMPGPHYMMNMHPGVPVHRW